MWDGARKTCSFPETESDSGRPRSFRRDKSLAATFWKERLDKALHGPYLVRSVNPPKTGYRHGGVLGLCATVVSLMLDASAFAHGTSHELIEAASREIAARPDDASLYLRRAFFYLEHGDWNACLLDVNAAERLQPQDPGAGLLRGRALAAGGRFGEAKAVLDGLLASHPDNAAALMQRARVLAALGQKAEAADEFARAMSHMPQPEPDHVFELVFFLCNAGRETDALAAIDKALVRMRGLQSLVDRAAEIEMKLGRHDAALHRLDDAIQTARIKEPLLAKRATLLARAGRTRDSIDEWKALQERILAMPPLERGSLAMSRLLEQARHASGALANRLPQ